MSCASSNPASPSLRERRDALIAPGQPGGLAFCEAYSEAADAWFVELLNHATRSDTEGVALLAVGSYGRRELCPWSDLDVVMVHHRRGDHDRVADAIWYPVWDQGIRLDHSVRQPNEVLAMAKRDIRVALGLVDSRHIAGDEGLAAQLIQTAGTQWRQMATSWLAELSALVTKRHITAGELAFLLEPDLKECHGGLRDLAALSAAKVAIVSLVDDIDLDQLAQPRELLIEVRVALHRLAGRSLDRLLLQEQDGVAALLGMGDADELMARIAQSARTIAWTSDDGWRRILHALSHSQGKHRRLRLFRRDNTGHVSQLPWACKEPPGSEPTQLSGTAFRVQDGELTFAKTELEHPLELAFQATAISSELDLPISRSCLEELGRHATTLLDPWPEAMREHLVRTLLAGRPSVRAMEALDQFGVLCQLIPEWRAVRNLPQRNAYHRFTVDRHLLETAANSGELAARVNRPDLLVIGSLLHDIGKGYPGDHTLKGESVVVELATRMGFSKEDVAVLASLVRNHLLLANAATRRDLDDPATIEAVAHAVGDCDRLELLQALTEADSKATGPAAWGHWKARLVAELAGRVRLFLTGQRPVTDPIAPTPAQRRLMSQRRLQVLLDGETLTVTAPDQPGLLAKVAGTLTIHGLDVRSADIKGEDGMAVELFHVEPSRGRWPQWQLLEKDLAAVLENRFPLEQRIDDRAKIYEPQRLDCALPAEISVTFDNDASPLATIVEVHAPDRLGQLYRISRAIAACDLDVASARVATMGHEVVDAFYVRTRDGRKVRDPEILFALRERISFAAANERA